MDSKALLKQLKEAQSSLKQYKSNRLAASLTANGGQPQTFAQAEFKACGRYGVKNLNELLKINVGAKKFGYLSEQEKETVKGLKEAVDVTLMIAQRFKMSPDKVGYYHEAVAPAIKALGINTGESGFEWIPTMVSDSYVEEYNLERKVAGLFTEVKMPSNPYTYPVLSNGAIARRLGEVSQLSPSDTFNTQATITFTAVKLSNQYALPEELQEDSAPDVMKVIRMELIQGQEKAVEIAILEGDTNSTYQHYSTQVPGATGAPTTDSSERVFDGLRKRALATLTASSTDNGVVDAGGQVVNESHLSSARKKMGKFGVNPAELALICGPKGYNSLLQLDDVRTLEQYGPQAPVLSGELAKYEGIPVIVSEYLREDLGAAGVNTSTAANNLFSSIIIVNRKRWFTGLRRAIQVRVENYRTQFDVWDMVSFSRKAFQGVLTVTATNFAGTGSGIQGEKSIAIIVDML